jgi:hypothetical protein
LDSQPGEAVAYAATPDGGYGLEFKILRSRLADDGNPGFDWWANSYIGAGAEAYPAGSATPTGAHNKYIFANAPPGPPPPTIGSYVYETNSALANPRAGSGVLGDTALTKLTDGIASDRNWLTGGQWVGTQDPAFVPANLAGDTELPQPRVTFVVDPAQPLDSVTITYLVDLDAKISAPDYAVVSFSLDGSEFGSEIVDFGFDNSPDGFPTVGEGAIRTLTIPLGGIAADRVRLDFFNDYEWTAIGEVQFAAVPEPSTGILLAIGAAGIALVAKRRRGAA